jgi:hypothetical protein
MIVLPETRRASEAWGGAIDSESKPAGSFDNLETSSFGNSWTLVCVIWTTGDHLKADRVSFSRKVLTRANTLGCANDAPHHDHHLGRRRTCCTCIPHTSPYCPLETSRQRCTSLFIRDSKGPAFIRSPRKTVSFGSRTFLRSGGSFLRIRRVDEPCQALEAKPKLHKLTITTDNQAWAYRTRSPHSRALLGRT